MLTQKKKKITVVFTILAIIMLAMLIYLFFFNVGLELTDARLTNKGVTVDIVNKSNHLIKDVSLYYENEAGEEELVYSIIELAPNSSEEVILLEDYAVNGVIKLILRSPYQQPIIKLISISEAQGIKLTPKLKGPAVMSLNQKTDYSLELCNEGDYIDNLTLELQFDESVLSSSTLLYQFSLAEDECKTRVFQITPRKVVNSTDITFNVKSTNFNENFTTTIEVRGS